MDCNPPVSFVYGILQARILEWVAISSSRGSSQPGDQTHITYVSCIGSAGSLPLVHSSILAWRIPRTEETQGHKELDSTETTWHMAHNHLNHLYLTYGKIYVSMLLSQIIPPSPSPVCPKVCSLCLHLYSCPANWFISTIFLDSIYIL